MLDTQKNGIYLTLQLMTLKDVAGMYPLYGTHIHAGACGRDLRQGTHRKSEGAQLRIAEHRTLSRMLFLVQMTESTEWYDLPSGADIAGISMLHRKITQLRVPNGGNFSEGTGRMG